ncbi:MAG: hypothetical protein CMP47_14620 [Rickettsiales bacterium]|nr:hypothetical protein [Rickettsiales bacterium]
MVRDDDESECWSPSLDFERAHARQLHSVTSQKSVEGQEEDQAKACQVANYVAETTTLRPSRHSFDCLSRERKQRQQKQLF